MVEKGQADTKTNVKRRDNNIAFNKRLEGTIPSDFGKCTEELMHFDVALTGKLPETFEFLSGRQNLHMECSSVQLPT